MIYKYTPIGLIRFSFEDVVCIVALACLCSIYGYAFLCAVWDEFKKKWRKKK